MTTWIRPSSCTSSGNCPEIAHANNGRLLIRSTRRPGVIVCLDPEERDALITAAKNGELDPKEGP